MCPVIYINQKHRGRRAQLLFIEIMMSKTISFDMHFQFLGKSFAQKLLPAEVGVFEMVKHARINMSII